MNIKTPKFWRYRNIISILLLPIAYIYYIISKIYRYFCVTHNLKSKIICVGNVTLGGAGKTPTVIMLAKQLLKAGRNVAIISRGYKGSLSNSQYVIKVDKTKHTAQEVGDEPLLLADVAPTYVSSCLYSAGLMAQKEAADIIIIDDGLQNTTLKKDISILVINASYSIGNGLLFPSGPLRETLSSAIKKTDIIFIVSDKINKQENIAKLTNLFKSSNFNKKIIIGKMQVLDEEYLKHNTFIGLCGIAIPEKFLETAKDLGVSFYETFTFPDHHHFTKEELVNIYSIAKQYNALVLTTSKDFVRIPQKYHHKTKVLQISYDSKNLVAAILTLLNAN